MTSPVSAIEAETKALEQFTDYFVKNYPGPDTIIFDPNWHAPKIFAAAYSAITAALVDVPAVEPSIPTANCCVCGRIIDTREISQGGDNFGAETAPGKWTCSMQCDDVVTGYVPDAPSRPEDAKAEQYWSTVEQLANCEDEISRLREILTRAEEYVIDGVTTAKAEAEMNAPYPARAPRYDAALAEVRQLYADIRAALAATRSGSATNPSGVKP